MKKIYVWIIIIVFLLVIANFLRWAVLKQQEVLFDEQEIRILAVYAHPDDEVDVSPVLGKLCRDLENECTVFVATAGEGGGDPDIRIKEMKKSAEILNMRLIQEDWPNMGYPGDQNVVLEKWIEHLGSRKELIEALERVILETNPDIVFLKDPRHGRTCHAEHMLISKLALLALNNTKGFSGMRIYFDENPTETFSVKDSKQVYFDASEYSNELGSDFWEYEV